jgi:beta-N-acetylhexosaminidase
LCIFAKKNGFVQTRSHQELGLLDPKESYKEAVLMGGMLKDCGININLAPVVDININPKNPIISSLERSFSSDPKVVVNCAAMFMEGLHEKGIMSCLKHFPGHGSSMHDTHVETADVTKLFKYDDELYPYKMLCGSTDLVMTSHVFNSNIDPEYPASMSKKTIDILRNELHFDGVVITDAIYMKALSSHFTIDKICEQCLLAGNDIILINASIENTIPYIENIIAKAKEDKIMLARIEESFKRVMALKSKVNK